MPDRERAHVCVCAVITAAVRTASLWGGVPTVGSMDVIPPDRAYGQMGEEGLKQAITHVPPSRHDG